MGVLAINSEAVLTYGPVLLAAAILYHFLSNYFNRGLHKYPGPFLARFTDVWRYVDVAKRRPEVTLIALHKRHGDIVRLGPNVLSFADPKAVKEIYGLNKGYVKSDFYPVQQAMANGKRLPSLFSTQDEAYHAQLRRSVNSAFSLSTLIQYEPAVDNVVTEFLRRTEEIYTKTNQTDPEPEPCDFLTWLQYYAFDAIGKVTYSKPHGFVSRNEDVDGIVHWLRGMFDYVAPVGQLPFLDLLLKKNPVWRYLEFVGLSSSTSPVVTFARARMIERLAETAQESGSNNSKQGQVKERPDLLAKFLQAKEQRPDFFHDGRVLTMAVSMALAGSETTAVTLSAVFYYLLKNPAKYDKAVAELDEALDSGAIRERDGGTVSFAEAQALPFFNSVVKEAMRMHPAVGLPLERVVPPQGAEICGERIAGGTIVGCSAWIINYRPEVFGRDADVFRPERWLEASDEKRREMDGTLFQFGAGSRTCIGKNISLLEMYKLVPAFLLRFKVSLADPSKEWKIHNAWFTRQKDFYTRFELRKTQPRKV